MYAWIEAGDRRLAAVLAIPPGTRILRLAALLAAHSGDTLLGVLAAGAALLLGGPAWREVGLRVLAANLVGGAVAVVLKWTIRRPRPNGERGALYGRLDRHSFPSGHAVRGAATVVLLAPLFLPWGWLVLLPWAFLVGLARVALGAHFATDVAGGWGIGAGVGGILFGLWGL